MKTILIIAGVLLILFIIMVRFNSKMFDKRIERIFDFNGDVETYNYLKSLKDGDQKLLGREVERVERELGIHHRK